jgi:hypothetical protein
MTRWAPFLALCLAAAPLPALADADADVAELRRQLAEQTALTSAQQKQLEQQAAVLRELSARLDALASTPAASLANAPSPPPASADAAPDTAGTRDNVGDLNSQAVTAGSFPGSFELPGVRYVSLAIGGFIKSVAVSDSDAEAMGASFTPAFLGTKRADTDGAFSIDSTLSRFFVDGRAPTATGQIRGYLEWDFNGSNDGNLDFKMRHAFGTWSNSVGTLTTGHTWSTFMDLKILPEGLTEPTVSGAIFNRQPQIRWSQALSPAFALHAAIEDPSSSDVFNTNGTPELGNISVPDLVLGLEYDRPGQGHLRLNGMWRQLQISEPDGRQDRDTGWGVSLSGHLNLFEHDKWVFSAIKGEGVGRYLLGIQPSAGAAVDPVTDGLLLNDNRGAFTAYQHAWTDTLRSSAMLGFAKSDAFEWQPGSTFESSHYAAVNLMWQVLPYMTLGVEYGYGKRENKDGSELDNNRISFGVQAF